MGKKSHKKKGVNKKSKELKSDTSVQKQKEDTKITIDNIDKVTLNKPTNERYKEANYKIINEKVTNERDTNERDTNERDTNEIREINVDRYTKNTKVKDCENKEDDGNHKKGFLDKTITIDFANISEKLNSAFHKYMDKNIMITGEFLYPFLYYTGLLIYLEFILHLIVYRNIDGKIIYPILFSVLYAGIFTLVTGFFKQLINIVLACIITVITCLLFCVQLIYYYVFKVYFSFQTIGMAGDAFSEFGSDIITAMKANIGGLILLFLPLLILALLQKYILEFNKRSIKKQAAICVGIAAIKLFSIISLMLFGKGDYTPYDLYYHSKVHDLCGKELGINMMMRIEVTSMLFGKDDLVITDSKSIQLAENSEPEKIPSTKQKKVNVKKVIPTSIPVNKVASAKPSIIPTQVPLDTSPNVMDIDFETLAKTEKDRTTRTLHQYFAAVSPTNKNKYTGIFKGYNLIMITAEGFSPYAVNKDKTPTLYQLTHEGFVFQNFYTPLWQTSTSDGEYVAMTGLIPVGSRSMYRSRKNYLPFALGNQFKKLGVASKAYHNHTYTYYQRNETHPNMGYQYKGIGNGLELPHISWPNSDLEMMNATVKDYIGEDQFHVYYMTVSGHMNYTFVGNSMSSKNRDLVKDLPYSSDCKAYIACQIELDKALKQLIHKLEITGVADRTVIALSADHYPYGWEKEKLDELAGHSVDPDFEIYRNHFILWNPGLKKNIVVDKPCSSLDILPTLSNLFGISYDSRLLMGQDVFSDSEPLVILSNRSFITDKVMYNTKNGRVKKLTTEKLPDNYIKTLNNVVKNKFIVSQQILEKDYYRKLLK